MLTGSRLHRDLVAIHTTSPNTRTPTFFPPRTRLHLIAIFYQARKSPVGFLCVGGDCWQEQPRPGSQTSNKRPGWEAKTQHKPLLPFTAVIVLLYAGKQMEAHWEQWECSCVLMLFCHTGFCYLRPSPSRYVVTQESLHVICASAEGGIEWSVSGI